MNAPTTPPEKLVAMARKRLDQTQEQLAARLTEITGETWTQGNISAIENRRRKLKVEELPAFAEAQQVKTTWYLGTGLESVLPPDPTSVGDSPRPPKSHIHTTLTPVTDLTAVRRRRKPERKPALLEATG